jgi:uncharacterized delta-60 repeat protein
MSRACWRLIGLVRTSDASERKHGAARFRPRLEALEDRTLLSAPGTLDSTFGSGGIVSISLSSSLPTEHLYAIGIDASGKILAAGAASFGGNNPVFALARFNTNGTLDTSFGSQGVVLTNVNASADAAGRGIVIQPDGKILVAGYGRSGSTTEFVVARYDSNGTLDSSFGSSGLVDTLIGNNSVATCVALQSDLKIVVAGGTTPGSSGSDFAVVRYNSDGTLDHSFGSNGVVDTQLGPSDASAEALALQADGKIVVVGHTSTSGGDFHFTLVRYTSTGALDTSFNHTGEVLDNFSGENTGFPGDDARGVVVQSNGAIVAVGGFLDQSSLSDVAIARYNSDGSPDTTFNHTGKVSFNIGGNDVANAVALQSNGKIVFAGVQGVPGGGLFLTGRLNADGSMDTGFGTNGLVTTKITQNANDDASSLLIQPDGKIVTAGSDDSGTDSNFALVRYIGDPLSVTGFNIQAPTSATAGTAFNITVTAVDNFGHTVTGYAGIVHFSSTDSQAALPHDYMFTGTDAGVHTFSLTLKTAGNQMFTVTDTSNKTITQSATVAVSPAAAKNFTVAGFPDPSIAGEPGNFTVTAKDPYGNIASTYAGTIHFTSSDTKALLPANSTLSHGTGTFSASFLTPGTQTLTATDTVNNTITGSETGLVINPNQPPVANPDSYGLYVNGSLDVAAAGVLANDTDAEHDPMTAVLVQSTSHGQVQLHADGSFNYAPVRGFRGIDTFSYVAQDVGGNSNVATVTIHVLAHSFLASDFAGSGVWRYEDTTGWQQLLNVDAKLLKVDDGGDVAADFAGHGLWRYEDNTGWVQLTGGEASIIGIDDGGGLVAEFPGMGVWRYTDQAGWTQLTGGDANKLAVDAAGDFVANFPGNGVYRHTDASGWQFLSPASAGWLRIDASGALLADFASQGIWRYSNQAGWQQLTGVDSGTVSMADNGDFVADFTGSGVWRWEAGSGWSHLSTSDASSVTIDEAGDVVASFGSLGLFRYEDSTNWQLLSGGTPSYLALDVNGTLAADFPGLGVWWQTDQNSWQRLTPADAALLAVDYQ